MRAPPPSHPPGGPLLSFGCPASASAGGNSRVLCRMEGEEDLVLDVTIDYGHDRVLVVDNLPVVPPEKVEKLTMCDHASHGWGLTRCAGC